MESEWMVRLEEELSKPYMQELYEFLQKERLSHIVYPPEDLVFSAFKETPFEKIKVVIVGQDPYHGPGQAHGMSFSVPEGTPLPPSLKYIFTEIKEDLGVLNETSGHLLSWARQGVFLLNATLTVRAQEPKSHYGKGWEQFTDTVIDLLLARKEPMVFLLWGKSAQEKGKKVQGSFVHKVLSAAHPSPFSVTRFRGCRHFSKANQFLLEWGYEPIRWNVESM